MNENFQSRERDQESWGKLARLGENVSSQIDDDKLKRYSGFEGQTNKHGIPEFRQKGNVIPHLKLLNKRYQDTDSSLMGVFPEIDRAWFTIENKIYIWDYNRQSCVEQEMDHLIISAALIPKPKNDVFHDWVNFLLVLATPVDLKVFALIFYKQELLSNNWETVNVNANPKAISDSDTTLVIESTPYYAPTDGVHFKSIKSLKGHIYLGGNDGNLYELCYFAKKGLFNKLCSLRNITTGFVKRFSSIFYSNADPIKQVEIDTKRQRLYTLSQNNEIQLFDYTGDITFSHSFSFFESLRNEYQPMQSTHVLLEDHCSIVSIHAVVHCPVDLMAITSNGFRVYFSVQTDSNTLQIIGQPMRIICEPMVNRSISLYGDKNDPFDIGAISPSWDIVVESYSKGNALLIAKKRERSVDVGDANQPYLVEHIYELIGMTTKHDPYRHTYPSDLINTFSIKSEIYSIAEIPVHVLKPDLSPVCDMLYVEELIDQFLIPSRQFNVLCGDGLHVYEKLRPIDQLGIILTRSRMDTLQNFMSNYAPSEQAALLLTLACKFGSNDSEDILRAKKAGEYFYSEFSSNEDSWHGAIQNVNNQGIAMNNVPDNSVAYHGLVLLVARVLRFVWETELLSIKVTVVEVIHPYLKIIRLFLDETRRYWINRKESVNWHSIYDLLSHSIDALSLAKLFSGYWDKYLNQEDILRDDIFMQRLHSFFSDVGKVELRYLVTDKKRWNEAQKAVMNWLPTLYPEELKIMREKLFRECKVFFRNDEYTNLIACEELKRALESNNKSSDRQRHVSNAKDMLLQIAPSLDLTTALIDLFKQLNEHDTLCDIALTVAVACDPKNEALNWFDKQNNDTAFMNDVILQNCIAQENEMRLQQQQYQQYQSQQFGQQLPPSHAQQQGQQGPFTSPHNQNQTHQQDYSLPIQPVTVQQSQQGQQAQAQNPIPTINLKFIKRMHCYKAVYPLLRNNLPNYLHTPKGSADKLFQFYVFNKLVEESTDDSFSLILQLDSNYLGQFLEHLFNKSLSKITDSENSNNELFVKEADLLGLYYMKRSEWKKVAITFSTLANCSGYISLTKRIDYLKRALLYASQFIKATAFCEELKARVEVADVQQQVVKELENMKHAEDLEINSTMIKALPKIKNRLLSVTDIYEEYAVKYHLFESCFSILQLCDYHDTKIITRTWEVLVKEYAPDNLYMLQGKVLAIGKKCVNTDFFPVEDIVDMIVENSFPVVSENHWNSIITIAKEMHNELHTPLNVFVEAAHRYYVTAKNENEVQKFNYYQQLAIKMYDIEGEEYLLDDYMLQTLETWKRENQEYQNSL